ncbi:hypothetical protein [Sinimarinibacterium thermocellulolyticum]|uniref:Uncharacterized protein n=1 Tax=Sinimarinibacterium thermocellulolyticum TaxID=3170016 RepID=A0ABV2A681_9GAMM
MLQTLNGNQCGMDRLADRHRSNDRAWVQRADAFGQAQHEGWTLFGHIRSVPMTAENRDVRINIEHVTTGLERIQQSIDGERTLGAAATSSPNSG